jgi:small subunit ribosomal protein S7
MPRKGPAQRRELVADPIYRSLLVTQLTNKVMLHGKKSTAEKIVYDALAMIEKKTGSEPIATLKRAIENVKPPLEVRSRRVGGATYQVPVETSPERQLSLALRWIVDLANNRKGVAFERALAQEIRDAAAGQGNAVKKRDETHRMAQANRAFAHLRW